MKAPISILLALVVFQQLLSLVEARAVDGFKSAVDDSFDPETMVEAYLEHGEGIRSMPEFSNNPHLCTLPWVLDRINQVDTKWQDDCSIKSSENVINLATYFFGNDYRLYKQSNDGRYATKLLKTALQKQSQVCLTKYFDQIQSLDSKFDAKLRGFFHRHIMESLQLEGLRETQYTEALSSFYGLSHWLSGDALADLTTILAGLKSSSQDETVGVVFDRQVLGPCRELMAWNDGVDVITRYLDMSFMMDINHNSAKTKLWYPLLAEVRLCRKIVLHPAGTWLMQLESKERR